MLWKGFQKPKRLTITSDVTTDRYAQFSAQPFERGFGTTIGNALRRVLLSSIEGAALTAVKIEGVLHEFSSIPGVVEDATDVILNLKQIPLKLHGEEPKTIYLKGTKPGVYTSANIEHDADRDYWMMADEAREYGMIDEVLLRSKDRKLDAQKK